MFISGESESRLIRCSRCNDECPSLTSEKFYLVANLISAQRYCNKLEMRKDAIVRGEISPLWERAKYILLCPPALALLALSVAALFIFPPIFSMFTGLAAGFSGAAFFAAVYTAIAVWEDTDIEKLDRRIKQEQKIISNFVEALTIGKKRIKKTF